MGLIVRKMNMSAGGATRKRRRRESQGFALIPQGPVLVVGACLQAIISLGYGNENRLQAGSYKLRVALK